MATITSKKRASRGAALTDAIETILRYPRSRTNILKHEIFNAFKITAKAYNDYYKTLGRSSAAATELYSLLQKIYTPEANTTGTPFNVYSSAYKKWSDKYGGKHPHHKEYSNISSQLRVIYEALLDIQDELDLGGDGFAKLGQEKGKGQRLVPSGFGTIDPDTMETGVLYSTPLKEGNVDTTALFKFGPDAKTKLPIVIEEFRRLYITALAISRKTDFDGDVDDLNSVTQDFVNGLDQAQWDVIKNKHVNVFKGEATMEIELVSPEMNALLNKHGEAKLGKYAQDLMSIADIPDSEWKTITSTVDFGKLKGSQAITDEVAQQLADILTTGKAKSKRTTTKKRVSNSRGSTRKADRIKKAKTRRVAPPNPSGRARKEQAGGEQAMSMIKLKGLINRSLPAEVRRNMERPALINRTGRFSNSVEITELRRGANGISGDYTYRLSPYETFENKGNRRWPTGYNPKKLITKSIRKLAEQYTKEKFIYLRRN